MAAQRLMQRQSPLTQPQRARQSLSRVTARRQRSRLRPQTHLLSLPAVGQTYQLIYILFLSLKRCKMTEYL